MSRKYSFELAQPAQGENIDKLLMLAFTPYVRKLGDRTDCKPSPWLKAEILEQNVYVCLDGEEIIGATWTPIRNDILVIERLAISPNYQNKGIGSWLLERIEQIAHQKNATAITLYTAENMEALLRFYHRHAYVESHRTPPDHGEDEYLRVHFSKQI